MNSMKYMRRVLFLTIVLYPFVGTEAEESTINASNLLIVIEDLRPEFINRSTMPNVRGLGGKGASLNRHHAVFPAIATVNAASIMTGTYPAAHGVLTTSSQNEIVAVYGRSINIITATTAGARKLFEAKSPPGNLSTPEDRNTWAVKTYLSEASTPGLTILWLGGGTENLEIGSEGYLKFLKKTDAQIGTILKAKKFISNTNIFVTSSGGTLTAMGEAYSVLELLVESGLKASADSDDVIVRGDTSIFVKGHDLDLIRRIVARLQAADWVGAIYTEQIRVTHPEGKAKGALSFQSVYIDHEGSPDIFVEPAFTDAANGYGIPGTKTRIGAGVTATSSPYALRIPFIAIGPDIKRRVQSDVPSANIDLAPTILHLLGIEVPDSMDGRVLHEILVGEPEPEEVKVLRRRHGSQVDLEGMTYRLMMTEYTVDGVDYFGGTRTERILKD
jgi:arylsulfatase A-like enzyme